MASIVSCRKKITSTQHLKHLRCERSTSGSRGFTIFEVLIVIGVGIVLVLMTLPVSVRFYQLSIADETANDIVSVFRRAESSAMLGKYDRAFGVKFLPNQYVFFQGASYLSRIATEDQIFVLPSGSVLSGLPDEIMFTKQTGVPSATGTLMVRVFDRIHHVGIKDGGVIEYVD